MEPKADPSLAETVASASLGGASEPRISRVTSIAEDEGRFVPGTLLGGRYRILTLLGRGGMGEVYRATDLTLGQSVALKFLPEEASRNQRLLERFHGEVRVARLVSHPNVCRVYDIGEIEGMPFISMEYVDGEDLASLLTRIGRLPADKAVETARKLCAGLAAAHDRGVIHRDLKPQNIMMNKRGEVVIMDFGLAAIADELNGAEARNGTPAYMSPEQLKGTGVTNRSDVYALGLVLYELFTGKKPYDASTLQQLMDMQESAHLTSMTSVAADIDPAVEKVIRRCLDPDPARRPSSAISVLAALPGGDPLAAALAAGETPSPEMVAAARVEGMPRRYSVPILAAVVLLLFGTIPLRQARTGLVHSALDQSPEVLAHQGRELASQFGYTERPADSAVWLRHRGEILAYLKHLPRPRAWNQWLAAEPALDAVYRESLLPMAAEPTGQIDSSHPPQLTPGMVRATVDGNGRLLDFSAVPLDGAEALTPAVSPETVFHAARLDLSTFSETTPIRFPPLHYDLLRAWKGPHPHLPATQLEVEIAWFKGRVTRVFVLYPWDQKPLPAAPVAGSIQPRAIWIPTLIAIATFVVVLRARANWIKERADRVGAYRIALASFLLQAVAWAGSFHPVATTGILSLFLAAVAEWLFWAVVLWFAYLALEPDIRARWPHSIVTWNRVLAGRWLDAEVGSHILIGAAAGAGAWVFFKAVTVYGFGNNEPSNWDVSLRFLIGARHWIAACADSANDGLSTGLFVFLAVNGMQQMLRNRLLAALAAAALFTFSQEEVAGREWWLVALLFGTVITGLIFVLLRVGLVAIISAVFFLDAVNGMALGGDLGAWYTPASIATLILLVAIAGFAFWRSLGGRELLEDEEAGARRLESGVRRSG
jgi:serine/threonine-protein kinase